MFKFISTVFCIAFFICCAKPEPQKPNVIHTSIYHELKDSVKTEVIKNESIKSDSISSLSASEMTDDDGLM